MFDDISPRAFESYLPAKAENRLHLMQDGFAD